MRDTFQPTSPSLSLAAQWDFPLAQPYAQTKPTTAQTPNTSPFEEDEA